MLSDIILSVVALNDVRASPGGSELSYPTARFCAELIVFIMDSASPAPQPDHWHWDTLAGFPVEPSTDAARDRIVCHPEVWAIVRAILVKQVRYTEIVDALHTASPDGDPEPVYEFFPRALRVTHSGAGGGES